ncbi:MAG: PQQ-binding-like beta-propeller repeat protein [Bacteroidota bacterium]
MLKSAQPFISLVSFISNFSVRIVFLLIIILSSCNQNKSDWEASFEGVTSSSSPQCTDLTGDGVLDIVMGAGGEEWKKTTSGILAVNGKNGQLIWKAKARNQIVGSAIFLDINVDKTEDIIIGGRSAELQALDGKTGKLIWEFYSKQGRLVAYDEGWHNFFNPQLVLDQDSDGIKDLLICNGGDALLAAGSKNRPIGKLLLISGKTGKILAQDQMPDGSETYSTPVCFDCDTNQNPSFIFGSGGETQGGNLFLTDLHSLKNKTIKNAKILASSSTKGFIAPPILADFNQDNSLDILVNQADGTTKLIDGQSHKTVWLVKCDSAEVYSQPGLGNFYGNDNIPDVFVSYAKGTYPTYKKTINYLVDGKTGKIVSKSELKRFTYSSPLVADLDQDGIDEIILNTVKDYQEHQQEKPYYELTIYNFAKMTEKHLGKKHYGACFASSPWLGDLDKNGKLDVVYSGSPAAISEFPGTTFYNKPLKFLQIHHLEMSGYSAKSVKWGSYLGKNGQSIKR